MSEGKTFQDIVSGEEFSLEDKVGQLWELGFNPFNVKLLAKSYRHSRCSMDGVSVDCGNFTIRIGPQGKSTWKLPKLKTAALDHLGLNPFAMRALAREYIDSKVKRQGIHMLIDDIAVMVGPQNKNTFILR